MAPPRLLLTGFGPFPGAPLNPTAEVVARIAAERRGAPIGVTIVPHVFATTWAGLDGLGGLLAAARPDAVLHLGLKRRARAITVERCARNRVLVAAVDADGRAPPGPMLDPEGPPRRPATLPVGRVAAQIAGLGLPVTVSEDAGRYLCNALLWRSLGLGGGRPCGFLHLPPTRGGGGAGVAPSWFTLDDLVRASLAAIAVVATRLRGQP